MGYPVLQFQKTANSQLQRRVQKLLNSLRQSEPTVTLAQLSGIKSLRVRVQIFSLVQVQQTGPCHFKTKCPHQSAANTVGKEDMQPQIVGRNWWVVICCLEKQAFQKRPTNQLSPTNCHQPTVTNQLPPTDCHGHQPVVINQLPPTSSCHPPIATNCYQLIVTNQLSPTNCHQQMPPTIATNQSHLGAHFAPFVKTRRRRHPLAKPTVFTFCHPNCGSSTPTKPCKHSVFLHQQITAEQWQRPSSASHTSHLWRRICKQIKIGWRHFVDDNWLVVGDIWLVDKLKKVESVYGPWLRQHMFSHQSLRGACATMFHGFHTSLFDSRFLLVGISLLFNITKQTKTPRNTPIILSLVLFLSIVG